MTEIGRKNKCDKNTLQFPAKEEGKKTIQNITKPER